MNTPIQGQLLEVALCQVFLICWKKNVILQFETSNWVESLSTICPSSLIKNHY